MERRSVSRLQLPDVTLVMVETRNHELAKLAIADCLKVIDFGDLVIVTDKPSEFAEFDHLKPQIKVVEDWPDKLGWSRSWWFDVPPMLRTRQTLNIQWDSWVWDTTMWTDDYLKYDYIGAPWWYKDGKNVGNGGFCLKSSRMARYIYDRRDQFPVETSLDDDLLCRKYRPKLEDAGFVWAPEPLAHDFAFECCRPSETSRHFGFHAMYNWPNVLSKDELLQRLRVARKSKYITGHSGLSVMIKQHPWVLDMLDADTEFATINQKELANG